MKIIVTGGPRAGKSTLAANLSRLLDLEIVHTDDYIAHGWSDVPDAVIEDLPDKDWIVEGCQAVRLCRRVEFDKLIWVCGAREELTEKQRALGKGTKTMLNRWLMASDYNETVFWGRR